MPSARGQRLLQLLLVKLFVTQATPRYYDFDLALAPRKCGFEFATACLPDLVILLSCCVREGFLHVFRIDAGLADWKRGGTALRLLRSTFTVDSRAAAEEAATKQAAAEEAAAKQAAEEKAAATEKAVAELEKSIIG